MSEYRDDQIKKDVDKMEGSFEVVPMPGIDTHNHTRGSDGKQTIFKAMLGAYRKGINIISITDHDSVRSYRDFERQLNTVVAAIKADPSYDPSFIIEMLENLKVIKGVELITSYAGVAGVEILVYNFDVDKMEKEIQYLKSTVMEKPYVALYKGFCKLLEERGVVFDKSILDDAYNRILTEGEGGVVGPFFNELYSHEENRKLLKYIDENGDEKIAYNLKLFINKHLYKKGSPWFVDMSSTRPSFKDTIDAAYRTGPNVVVELAHSGRYADKMPIREYIDSMIEMGIDGLEVWYPDHDYEFSQFLLGKAREYGLKASGGSDDHHTIKEGAQYKIGRVAVPSIPETKWIHDTIDNKGDFLSECPFVQRTIEELKIIKEIRDRKRANNEEER